MKTKAITHIGDLTPDPKNARKHNPRNVGMIVDALHEVGAARSIVVDEDGVVLAGNATVEAAAEAGITKVMVVDADGETIVAVRRTGLTEREKTRLALFDNRAAELAGWDAAALAEYAVNDPGALDSLFTKGELDALGASAVPDFEELDEPAYSRMDEQAPVECPHCGRAVVVSLPKNGGASDVQLAKP